MSIYTPREEKNAKRTAAMLALFTLGLLAFCIALSHQSYGDLPKAASGVSAAARGEILHQAEGRGAGL